MVEEQDKISPFLHLKCLKQTSVTAYLSECWNMEKWILET